MTRLELLDTLNIDAAGLLGNGWLDRALGELVCDDLDDPDFDKPVSEEVRLSFAEYNIKILRQLADTALTVKATSLHDRRAGRTDSGQVFLKGWSDDSRISLLVILQRGIIKIPWSSELYDCGNDQVFSIGFRTPFEDRICCAAEALLDAVDWLHLTLRDRSPFICKCPFCGLYFAEEGTRKYCRGCSAEADRLSNNRAQAKHQAKYRKTCLTA